MSRCAFCTFYPVTTPHQNQMDSPRVKTRRPGLCAACVNAQLHNTTVHMWKRPLRKQFTQVISVVVPACVVPWANHCLIEPHRAAPGRLMSASGLWYSYNIELGWWRWVAHWTVCKAHWGRFGFCDTGLWSQRRITFTNLKHFLLCLCVTIIQCKCILIYTVQCVCNSSLHLTC